MREEKFTIRRKTATIEQQEFMNGLERIIPVGGGAFMCVCGFQGIYNTEEEMYTDREHHWDYDCPKTLELGLR